MYCGYIRISLAKNIQLVVSPRVGSFNFPLTFSRTAENNLIISRFLRESRVYKIIIFSFLYASLLPPRIFSKIRHFALEYAKYCITRKRLNRERFYVGGARTRLNRPSAFVIYLCVFTTIEKNNNRKQVCIF